MTTEAVVRHVLIQEDLIGVNVKTVIHSLLMEIVLLAQVGSID